MSLIENVEKLIKNQNEHGLKHLMTMYGVNLNLLKLRESKETVVYGRDATTNFCEPIKIKGIIVNDDFFPSDSGYAGTFKSGFLYTNSKKVDPGDIIEIIRQDSKSRRFKVKEIQSIGTTVEVFRRYEISSLGD